MVTTFSILSITLIVFMIYRKWNNKYQEAIFREKLFELRDKLRNLAIEKKINKKSKEFDYIDFSISKNIEDSYFFTLFFIIRLEIRYKSQIEELHNYKEIFERIQTNINSNEYLKEIFIEKNKIIMNYVFGQIPVTVFIVRSISRLISKASSLRRLIKMRLSEVNYLPELSAIKSFS
jgi:hypothetical protein